MPERIRILHTLNIQGTEAGSGGPGAIILATQEAEGGRTQIQGLCGGYRMSFRSSWAI